MTTTKLSTENARAFNSSLKKALKEQGYNVKVEIINSYKFPNCWVRIHATDKNFDNDLRLRVFDANDFNRSNLNNQSDVSYGNIRNTNISAYVHVWEKIFN